jgi:kynurenine formamidase
MGPLPDLAEPTHYAGLKHGMIWTESATGLTALPPTGAFYCVLSPKHARGPYAEARAFAIVGDPLARRLIDSARKKNVVDLSVVLADDLPTTWPGSGIGNHRQPYMRIPFGMNPNTKTPFETHLLDSHAGTHLVPPAYSEIFEGSHGPVYSPQVSAWLAEYEANYGPRVRSRTTAEEVPIAQTCGPARIIDVTHLLGKADRGTSPEITPAEIQRYEEKNGVLRAGDVVIFRSGWSDRFYRPFPEGKAFMDDPLNGRSEGWPAPGPKAVVALAKKGVRCVATDGPTLGGVEPKRALMTYWALGSRGIVGVESLTNLGRLPEEAYFLFAAVKVRGCHGGPGRAIALYP